MTVAANPRVKTRVLVNTGHGKGKSSAAFGVMGRAWARGWTVFTWESEDLDELTYTVTEMRKIKHAYDEGIGARKGIEY